ncbi:MAG: hypothetical protein IIC89_07720, partial [Chloroflexi bacterium]|nr:hypothetical protein [Chloroflexota bacterium]
MMVTSWRVGISSLAVLLIVAAAGLMLAYDNNATPSAEAVPPTDTPIPTATPIPVNAEARVIALADDLIAGPLSRGVLGDYYLANDEIQVVIQAPQRNLLNVGQYGGQIIDADLIRQGLDPERDSWEEWALGINIENTAHYTSVSVINDGSNGQPAVIRATGVDDLLDFINPSSLIADLGFVLPPSTDDTDLPITISTDYILAPGAEYVEVETTITSTDAVDTVDTYILDYIGASGELEQFLPGYGFGEPLATLSCALCNYIAWAGVGDAEGVSYGYIHDIAETTQFSDAGVLVPLLGANVLLTLVGAGTPNYIIDPLGSVSVTRYFAIADGSVGAIIDIRNDILGLTTGTIEGNVTRNGQPVEGADVVVFGAVDDGPGADQNVVAHYTTDANGDYQGTPP